MNTAILFDTMSIQNYVFGSNKLKENLGASYLVENVYRLLLNKEAEKKLDIGYIGGGNALVFVSNEHIAKELVTEFTTNLLYESPALSVSVAIDHDFSRAEPYTVKLTKLFEELAINKGRFAPVNIIPTHGITAVCAHTGNSVEGIINYEEKSTLLSSVAISKIGASIKAKEEGQKLLEKARIQTEFSFTDQLDKLGHKKYEDSHIAVVHIDGNGFGDEFRNLNDIESTKALSLSVKKAVQYSFIYVLEQIHNRYKDLAKIVEFSVSDDRKLILPVRPIILGGDDVTFVCHGKLGIWLAEIFMRRFNENKLPDGTPYTSCAGVAVVKTKYPFYRAYQLAEELCTNAKKKRKDNNDNRGTGNWIDFHLSYGGLGNSLEEVRSLQYQTINNKQIYKRPYHIDSIGTVNSFTTLKNNANKLEQSLPNSKIKDLREMLNHDHASQEVLIEHLIHQHEDFKKIFFATGNSKETLENYPFFDMIELLELYPSTL